MFISLDSSLQVNALNICLVYKDNYAASDIDFTVSRQFCTISLVSKPIQKLNADPRQQSESHSKRKLADHKLQEKEGSTRNVGRRCAGYYVNGRTQ